MGNNGEPSISFLSSISLSPARPLRGRRVGLDCFTGSKSRKEQSRENLRSRHIQSLTKIRAVRFPRMGEGSKVTESYCSFQVGVRLLRQPTDETDKFRLAISSSASEYDFQMVPCRGMGNAHLLCSFLERAAICNLLGQLCLSRR